MSALWCVHASIATLTRVTDIEREINDTEIHCLCAIQYSLYIVHILSRMFHVVDKIANNIFPTMTHTSLFCLQMCKNIRIKRNIACTVKTSIKCMCYNYIFSGSMRTTLCALHMFVTSTPITCWARRTFR